MPEPVIIEAVRIPFGKRSGLYRETRPDALLAHTLCGLVERVGIDLPQIEDIIAGCVTQAGEQGANIGRLAALLAFRSRSREFRWTGCVVPASKRFILPPRATGGLTKRPTRAGTRS